MTSMFCCNFYIYCFISFTRSYEFGGPWGVVAIMTCFPVLMYYFWICLWFYDGKLVHPASVEDIQPFVWRMCDHIRVVRSFTYSARQYANSRA